MSNCDCDTWIEDAKRAARLLVAMPEMPEQSAVLRLPILACRLMWFEASETQVSKIDGKTYEIPALVSDNGAKITRGGVLPERVRVIYYTRGAIQLRIAITQYDSDLRPQKHFIIFLETALRRDTISNADRLIVIRDLEAALPNWRAIIDPDEPRVNSLVFQ